VATTKHLGIRDAVAALFAAGTALAGGRIHENRDLPLPQDVASQIQVYRDRSTPGRDLVGGTAPIDWTTEVRVIVKARKSGATSAELVADDIVSNCFARVMADQTLGGLCFLLDPGEITWDQDEADSTVVVAAMQLQIVHRTTDNVIT
jgi:hypothetical protein